MDSDLRALYQELILDHGKQPRNFGKPDAYTHSVDAYNPLCGDHIVVYGTLSDEAVEDIHFTGKGCAICMASASLMSQETKHKSRADAETLYRQFLDKVTGRESDPSSTLGRLDVLSGVRGFPTRIKCATLAWHALAHILSEKTGETVTTE
ncbi:MAG: SUF system NifU family Fe-S cluster assembly protein [Exilibacterium sp.]